MSLPSFGNLQPLFIFLGLLYFSSLSGPWILDILLHLPQISEAMFFLLFLFFWSIFFLSFRMDNFYLYSSLLKHSSVLSILLLSPSTEFLISVTTFPFHYPLNLQFLCWEFVFFPRGFINAHSSIFIMVVLESLSDNYNVCVI